MKNKLVYLAVSSSLLIAAGCQDPATGDGSLQTGVLLDSAVSGIDYATASQSGTTGADGSFQYRRGETITFSVGDITLPSVAADRIITPLDMSVSDLVNDKVTTNIARFLQALDSDGNPDNGISIDPNAHTEAANDSVDFSVDDFETEVSQYVADLQATLPSADEAKAHLESTIATMVDGQAFSAQIRDGITSQQQNLIRGSGYLSSEFADTCKDLGNLLFGSISIGIEACFNVDGTGTISVGGTGNTFTWSIDSEGALLITINSGGTIRLIRLVDGQGNDAGAYIDIAGLPGAGGVDIGSIGNVAPVSAQPLQTGVLLDSAVGGIDYSTASQSGTTGPDGSFLYREGETITFSIGDITLPSVAADRLITPLDMTVSDLVNDKIATNIARLLQAVDSDGDPDNGITIDISAHTEAANESVDFSIDDFETEVAQYVADLQATLPSAEEAKAHLESTIATLVDGQAFSAEIRDGISSHYQDLIRGSGYLSSEFADSCQDLGSLIFGAMNIGIEACFNADGSGAVSVGEMSHAFSWSIDGEGALLITLDNGGTIRLIRLVDEEGNDAGAYIETVGLPGAEGIDIGSIGNITSTLP